MQRQMHPTPEHEVAGTIASAPAWLMAIGAGVGVANIYYIQPVVPAVRATFALTAEQASLVPAVSQAGYAVAMLLFAPIGDLIDRKRVILVKSVFLVLALLAAASAANLTSLVISSFALGLFGSVGQDFIPLAAHLTSAQKRGATIGVVTTGLLSGILLSRTAGGLIGDIFGWRAIFATASVVVALVGLAIWRRLPAQPPATRGSYPSMLLSLFTLVRRHAVLRKSLETQALLAATLGSFWSTIALMLASPPFYLAPGPRVLSVLRARPARSARLCSGGSPTVGDQWPQFAQGACWSPDPSSSCWCCRIQWRHLLPVRYYSTSASWRGWCRTKPSSQRSTPMRAAG